MRVHGQKVPLLLEVFELGCAGIVTAERVHLRPGVETRIQCQLTRMMRGVEGVIEPTEHLRLDDGVAVGRSLLGA